MERYQTLADYRRTGEQPAEHPMSPRGGWRTRHPQVAPPCV